MSKQIKESAKDGGTTLHLESTKVTKDLYKQIQKKLPNLTCLKLINCNIDSLKDDQLFTLTQLELLDVSGISELHHSIVSFVFCSSILALLRYLTILFILVDLISSPDNHLSEVPAQFQLFYKLQYLSLRHNNFKVLFHISF